MHKQRAGTLHILNLVQIPGTAAEEEFKLQLEFLSYPEALHLGGFYAKNPLLFFSWKKSGDRKAKDQLCWRNCIFVCDRFVCKVTKIKCSCFSWFFFFESKFTGQRIVQRIVHWLTSFENSDLGHKGIMEELWHKQRENSEHTNENISFAWKAPVVIHLNAKMSLWTSNTSNLATLFAVFVLCGHKRFSGRTGGQASANSSYCERH